MESKKRKPGPKPGRLRIEGRWDTALSRALTKPSKPTKPKFKRGK